MNPTTTPTPETQTQAQTITITHTNEDGTLVTGTQRGDGSRDALRLGRLRWSRRLDAWFIPQSRGSAPRHDRINQLADSLRAAGFDVTVQVEEYNPQAAFDAKQTAAAERTERLADAAERERARGGERSTAAHDAVAGIPPGQPVLAGHHSERHHRAALARSDAHERAAREHQQNAASAQERSNAAARQARRRENPVVMGRKVQRLEADERQLERILRTATGDYAKRIATRRAEVQADIAFLKGKIEQTGVRQFTAEDFEVGDSALIRGRWRLVERVNAKSLSVATGYSWNDKYPYHEVTGRRAAGELEQPVS